MFGGIFSKEAIAGSLAQLKGHRVRLEEIRESRLLSAGPVHHTDLQILNSEIRRLVGVEGRLEVLLMCPGRAVLH